MTATFDNMYYTTTTASINSDVWYTTEGDKYETFYTNNYNGSKTGPATPKNDFKTKLIADFINIINELHLIERDISIAAFTKYKSDIERDLNVLQSKIPCYVHFIHPIKSDPQNDPVNLSSYDVAIIPDILGNSLSRMANANIIKEALSSLKQGGDSYLMIASNNEEKSDKSTEIALNEEDLISLAIYAGATKAWKFECGKEIEFPIIVATNGG